MKYHEMTIKERDSVRAEAMGLLFNAFASDDDDAPVPSIDVQFVSRLTGDDEMWHAYVTFDRPLTAMHMHDILYVVDRITCNDDMTFRVNGREYRVGDGDDTSAVSFIGGMIRVWVRHLEE